MVKSQHSTLLTVHLNTDLLRLLELVGRRRRRRVQPHDHKGQEASDHRPQTGDPHPASADSPAACVLVVRIVAHGHLVLLLDVGEEGSLVVDTEGEDAVLIRRDELGAEYSARFSATSWLESQTVERREHGELQLQFIPGGDLVGHPLVVDILGDFNVVDL